jgi:pimeloyl-ACP methyl ester carboxylesterase
MPLPSTLRDVAVDGLRFRIRSSPVPASAADARPAVLLHGLGMSQRSMARLQDRMALRRAVHGIDLPGFGGRRPPRRDVPIAAMAEALGRALDELGVRDAVVVGQSLGAQWTVELAALRPDLVASVVLIGPVVDDLRSPRAALAAGIVADLLREPPSVAAIELTDVLRTDPGWFFAQAEHMLRHPLLERVAALRTRALVLAGGRDPVARRPWLRRLRDAAAECTLVIVPASAHHAQCTAPGAVAEAIDAFLGERPADGDVAAGPIGAPAVVDDRRTTATSAAGRAGRPAPPRPAPGTALARRLAWWAADYAYALRWQLAAALDRTDPEDYTDGDRTPVVVLPGVYETWRFLHPLVRALHERGHPVHVVTALQGNRVPVAEGAKLVAAQLERLDLRDVVIAAHSKGGLIGKQVMLGGAGRRVRGMVAVATPFGGSRYGRLMLGATLRAFSPRDATIRSLAAAAEVNARIVSVLPAFDPHIPEGSALLGAKNVPLAIGGHFRVLAHPRVIAEVVALAAPSE